ncbi:hypothetical protein [Nocardioides nitrophenolicus]|uniref:hypothetical protein n=1 Tax=Nocardioides nitrophenolicus TaxID=60489 RepID=UPI001958EBDF|nr:hypothetical protein [Nocardioides nitrophenolicus]MBM7515720.1 hypothetical protein [Nocardioides nitrophenolicus]
MEILLWLLPAAVLTLASMAWVAWWGREGRGEVDRETAARRLGEALTREQRSRPGYAAPRRAPERHTGVALRASQARPSVVAGGEAEQPVVDAADPADDQAGDATGDRRAS